MTTTTPTFDPVAYKTTTRSQWEQAAEAWHRWGPTLEVWLGPATELMLDLAAAGPRAARTVQPRRARRAGVRVGRRRLRRRRGASGAGAAAAAVGRRMRPLRARVLRRAAPDARRP